LVGTAEAVRLLVEIGVDTVSARGRRFWDSKPADQPSD
jgi:phosphotransferase system IIA component